jgi:hypothetical protein
MSYHELLPPRNSLDFDAKLKGTAKRGETKLIATAEILQLRRENYQTLTFQGYTESAVQKVSPGHGSRWEGKAVTKQKLQPVVSTSPPNALA